MDKQIIIPINPYFTGWNMGERCLNVFPITTCMDERILELSKIYALVHGARVSLAKIPEKSRNIADLFELKLSPKVLRN